MTVTNVSAITETATIKVYVRHVNHAPYWTQSPIQVPTKVGQLTSMNLSLSAADPDGDVLTFKLVSGPSWASLGPNGVLSGTPGPSNVGENTFIIAAADGVLEANNTLVITVQANPN